LAPLTFNKPGSGLLSLIFICTVLFAGSILSAQPTVTISGRVFRNADSLPLTGASVYDHNSGRGSVTDTTGSFQLTLSRGQHNLRVSYLGYKETDTVLSVSRNLKLDFYLTETTVTYKEVIITADARKDYVTSTQMGEIWLDNLEISRLPSLLGESDPIRLLQLTPGVQSGTEGGVGFYVRGGGVDQNLVLIDNAVIYNPGHLMGFLSVFNPDIIKEVSLIKSGIPARYGGRMSSVVNAETYKGSGDSLSIKGQIGLLSSRISVNRSLNKGKGSFYLSARQAYPDLVIKPAMAIRRVFRRANVNPARVPVSSTRASLKPRTMEPTYFNLSSSMRLMSSVSCSISSFLRSMAPGINRDIFS
jgi:hypothetical protein